MALARAGWPKALASDWLNSARRHLEVKLALEVSQIHVSETKVDADGLFGCRLLRERRRPSR